MSLNPCWAEISLGQLKENFALLRRHLGADHKVMAVVKADAYGHGAVPVARALEQARRGGQAGADALGVAAVEEGVELRQAGLRAPIVLLTGFFPGEERALIEFDITAGITEFGQLERLEAAARAANRRLRCHVKVDTGMGRLGVWHNDAYKFIRKIHRLKNLTIQGLYTHFPAADTDKKFTQGQIHRLSDLITRLDNVGIVIPHIHASNSMGMAGYNTKILNLFRPGIMLYGLYPHASLKRKIKLKPV